VQSESKKVLNNAEQAAVGLELNGVNAHCPQVEGWGFLAATQASPEFPPSCADLSAECKLQPRAVAVKFLLKFRYTPERRMQATAAGCCCEVSAARVHPPLFTDV